MKVCDQTFDQVLSHLQSRNYSGPTALSCDDTKLLPSLRMYWDNERNSHFLVGAVSGPIEVTNPSEIEPMMDNPDLVLGTKVTILYGAPISANL